MIRRQAQQSGLSYVELLVALVLIAVALPPAMQALRVGLDGASVQSRSAQLAQRAAGTMETVLTEPFVTLRAAAAGAGAATAPSSYSDAAGASDRMLVYLSYYDAADSDGDGNSFTILDPNPDGDGNPYTGAAPRIALLWVRVQAEGTALAFESLASE